MFGKMFQRSLVKGNQAKTFSKMPAMSFRSTAALGKKPNIGEASEVLLHKITGISQVVSIDLHSLITCLISLRTT